MTRRFLVTIGPNGQTISELSPETTSPMSRFTYGPGQSGFSFGGPIDPTATPTEAEVILSGITVEGNVPTVDLTIVPFDPAKQVAPIRAYAVFSAAKPADTDKPEDWIKAPGNFVGQCEIQPDPVAGTKLFIAVTDLPPVAKYEYVTVLEWAA